MWVLLRTASSNPPCRLTSRFIAGMSLGGVRKPRLSRCTLNLSPIGGTFQSRRISDRPVCPAIRSTEMSFFLLTGYGHETLPLLTRVSAAPCRRPRGRILYPDNIKAFRGIFRACSWVRLVSGLASERGGIAGGPVTAGRGVQAGGRKSRQSPLIHAWGFPRQSRA